MAVLTTTSSKYHYDFSGFNVIIILLIILRVGFQIKDRNSRTGTFFYFVFASRATSGHLNLNFPSKPYIPYVAAVTSSNGDSLGTAGL